MLLQGDSVQVTKIEQSVKDMLSEALDTDFEDIDFYFEEYEGEHYAILSAQADEGYAIIKCPLAYIDDYYNDAETVDQLIDHVLNTLTMDHALATGNKALFDAIHEYNANKKKGIETPVPEPEDYYLGVVIDVDGEDYIKELLADEE